MLTKERNSETRGNGNGISVARDLEPCSLKYGLTPTPEESDSISLKESSVAPTREREVSAKAESESLL